MFELPKLPEYRTSINIEEFSEHIKEKEQKEERKFKYNLIIPIASSVVLALFSWYLSTLNNESEKPLKQQIAILNRIENKLTAKKDTVFIKVYDTVKGK